jgi:hypothetical protein
VSATPTAGELLVALEANSERLAAASIDDLKALDQLVAERARLLKLWEHLETGTADPRAVDRLRRIWEAGAQAEHKLRLARAYAAAELARWQGLHQVHEAMWAGLDGAEPDCDLRG